MFRRLFNKKNGGESTEASPTKVFGVEAPSAVEHLPSFLFDALIHLEVPHRAVEGQTERVFHEGIFRKAGSKARVNELIEQIDSGIEVDFSTVKYVHNVADVAKRYYKDMPSNLLSPYYDDLCQACSDRVKLRSLLTPNDSPQSVTPSVAILSKALFHTLSVLYSHVDQTLMTPENCCRVFTPTILKPRSLDLDFSRAGEENDLFATLIQEFDYVFGDGGEEEPTGDEIEVEGEDEVVVEVEETRERENLGELLLRIEELGEENEELRRSNKDLKIQFSSSTAELLQRQLKTATDSKRDLTVENTKLRRDLVQSRTELASSQQEISSLHSQLSTVTSSKAQSDDEVSKLDSSLRELRLIEKDHRTKLSEVQSYAQGLSSRLETTRSELEITHSALETSSSEVLRLSELLDEAQEEISKLSIRVGETDALETELHSKKEEIGLKDSVIAALESEIEGLRGDLHSKMGSLGDEISHLREEKAIFESEAERWRVKVEALETENSSLLSSLAELETVSKSLASLQREHKSLEDSVAEITEERDSFHAQAVSVQAEVAKKSFLLAASTSREENLKRENEAFVEQISLLKEAQENASIRIAELEESSTNLDTGEEASEIEEEREELRSRVRSLASELSALEDVRMALDERLEATIAAKDSAQKESQSLRVTNETLLGELDSFRSRRREYSSVESSDSFERLAQRHQDLVTLHEMCGPHLTKLESLVQDLESELAKALDELKRKEVTESEMHRMKTEHEDLVSSLKSNFATEMQTLRIEFVDSRREVEEARTSLRFLEAEYELSTSELQTKAAHLEEAIADRFALKNQLSGVRTELSTLKKQSENEETASLRKEIARLKRLLAMRRKKTDSLLEKVRQREEEFQSIVASLQNRLSDSTSKRKRFLQQNQEQRGTSPVASTETSAACFRDDLAPAENETQMLSSERKLSFEKSSTPPARRRRILPRRRIQSPDAEAMNGIRREKTRIRVFSLSHVPDIASTDYPSKIVFDVIQAALLLFRHSRREVSDWEWCRRRLEEGHLEREILDFKPSADDPVGPIRRLLANHTQVQAIQCSEFIGSLYAFLNWCYEAIQLMKNSQRGRNSGLRRIGRVNTHRLLPGVFSSRRRNSDDPAPSRIQIMSREG